MNEFIKFGSFDNQVTKSHKILLVREKRKSIFVDKLINSLRNKKVNIEEYYIVNQDDLKKLLFVLNQKPTGTQLYIVTSDFLNLHLLIKRCEELRIPTILFDDPTLNIPKKYINDIVNIHLKAINIEYSELRNRNEKVKNLIDNGDSFQIKSPNGTNMKFQKEKGKRIFVENCKFSENESLFQIPGGEVFFAPKPFTAEGIIIQECGSKKAEITINNGFASFNYGKYKNKKVPFAEFGIGTNQGVRKLKFLSSYEKCLGTCHIGFGNNINMDGIFEEPYHFDIVIDNFQLSIDGEAIFSCWGDLHKK
ncbi:aminopeptidase [Bacillus sp. SM2101]|uniref:aminopeptidase n=1 Tax=Bacillus sp. SM2101 TaxID=2805366 RepID=UPI001BDE5C6E|nr:aminopeptidase [Bacillus sp. SM2101]